MNTSGELNENQIHKIGRLWGVRRENQGWILYHGYDDFDILDQEYFQEHPRALPELKLIASEMIERWTQFKHVLEGGDVVDGDKEEGR